jgi:hypothetical protein
MQRVFHTTVVLILISYSVRAQTETTKTYSNFPLIVTLQFQSLALPFRDLRSNFSNIGLGIGTEVSYNSKNNLLQQVHAIWYHNRTIGNGILLYTQPCWRPSIASDFYAEVKAGVGYLYSFRPVESYRPQNGEWVSAGHHGKGMLALPLGLSIGYEKYSSTLNFSPFISYQFLVVSGYSKSIPVVPETLIQVGSRIHFNNQ